MEYKIIRIKKILERYQGNYVPIPFHLIDIIYDLYTKFLISNIESVSDNSVGLLYYGFFHKTITKNYDLAKYYYLNAIKKGNVDAMHNLAHYYSLIEKNYEKAIYYYLLAISHGNSTSMYHLAQYFDFIVKDKAIAMDYYQQAINKGNINAMHYLAWYYTYKEHDHSEAKKYCLMYFNLASSKQKCQCISIINELLRQKFDCEFAMNMFIYLCKKNRDKIQNEIKNVIL